MAIIQQNINANNARFPTPKQPPIQPLSFPNDLNVGDREFYTQIQFQKYSPLSQFNLGNLNSIVSDLNTLVNGVNAIGSLLGIPGTGIQLATNFTPAPNLPGAILLPIPKKINDATTLSWNEQTALGLGSSLANIIPGLGGAINAASQVTSATSFLSGVTVNPFLFMFFQRQNFKEFVLQWTLTPNTPKESTTILNIINTCKSAALPTAQGGGSLLQYPLIAQISLYPSELQQHLIFKPCAIISVQADYTGTGSPSFFKNTKLPTVVNLTLSLKEIQLWDSSELPSVI